MPLFKGQGCKSTPAKAIAYITDNSKASIITSHALDDTRSYSTQFKETAALYSKGKKYDERKYYHFKLSCDQADNVSPELSHALAESMVNKFFSSHECVIATHTDTATIHSHIIINAVNFETGNKFHCNNKQYAAMKDAVNDLGQSKGLSILNWRQPSQDRQTTAEKRIQLKGGTSWKEELKDVIAEAIQNSLTFDDFTNHLKKYGVTLERNTEKTISFKHPSKDRPIRGDKLGQLFTKGAIQLVIDEHRNRTTGAEPERIDNNSSVRTAGSEATRANAGSTAREYDRTIRTGLSPVSDHNREQRTRSGEQPAEEILDVIQREIRGVAEGVKLYTPSGRDELRKREAKELNRAEEERRAVETAASDRDSAKGRQRAAEPEHEKPARGLDLER